MRQNWEITFASTVVNTKQRHFFFTATKFDRKCAPWKHSAFVPQYLYKYFSLPPDLIDCNPPPPSPAQSFMAQMPPLIITQSLPLCTQLPFSLCSLALADTRGPSERISAVLLTEFRHGYINKMPVPPASANHYPDTLCTDYSYRQWRMNINYSLSLRHQTSRMWSENIGLIVGDKEWILCDKKKKKNL